LPFVDLFAVEWIVKEDCEHVQSKKSTLVVNFKAPKMKHSSSHVTISLSEAQSTSTWRYRYGWLN
jgi:hypothetical protein